MSIGLADDEDIPIDLAGGLGSTQDDVSPQRLTLYIPSRDRNGLEFGYQRKWVLKAAELLTRIGGGVTIMPAAEGGWLNPETNSIVWESVVLVYTYVIPENLREELINLRALLHAIGRDTNQGEVVLQFDDELYRIKSFEPSSGGAIDVEEN